MCTSSTIHQSCLSVAILAQEVAQYWLKFIVVMASDSDDEVLAPPPLENSSDSNDEVRAPAPARSPPAERARAVRARPPAPRRGTFGAWLTSSTAPSLAASSSAAPPCLGEAAAGSCYVLALATVEWEFTTETEHIVGNVTIRASTLSRGAPPWGKVLYKLVECHALQDPFNCSSDVVAHNSTLELERAAEDRVLKFREGRVRDLLSTPEAKYDRILDVPPHFVERAAVACPVLVRTVMMLRRMEPDALVPHNPPESWVTKWRKECGVCRKRATPVAPSEAEVWENACLELPRVGARTEAEEPAQTGRGPARLKQRRDPVKVIDALDFARHLRSLDDFSVAIDKGNRYDREADDSASDVVRDATKDPSTAALHRAKRRMDTTGMLLERRLFHADMATDNIDAISIFTDASPTTGSEIQGLVAEFILKSGEVRSCVLPGATLSYSHCDAVSKTLCLVWAVWLCCGPLLEHLTYFFWQGAVHHDGLRD